MGIQHVSGCQPGSDLSGIFETDVCLVKLHLDIIFWPPKERVENQAVLNAASQKATLVEVGNKTASRDLRFVESVLPESVEVSDASNENLEIVNDTVLEFVGRTDVTNISRHSSNMRDQRLSSRRSRTIIALKKPQVEDMTSSRAPEPSSAQKDSFLVPFEFSDNTPLRSDGAASGVQDTLDQAKAASAYMKTSSKGVNASKATEVRKDEKGARQAVVAKYKPCFEKN
ncbi:hypothetical protein F2Q68_00025741 [Brassica cretica]|uniref:Uncharacterized protein n=1 Tax=Brassica cretica TaxID=69181 RepID=A0A8S9I7D2_BRACR|nr:hypothetical protein F2Q68_00025741 [Brassica cretica]